MERKTESGGTAVLVVGIVLLFMGLLIIILVYTVFWARTIGYEKPQVVINDPSTFIGYLLLFMFGAFFCGSLGGYFVGRYVQAHLSNKAEQLPPPPK